MTIASFIYQEMKLPCVIGITSAAYCAATNKNIQNLEKPIKYTNMLFAVATSIPVFHGVICNAINYFEGAFSYKTSRLEKSVLYIATMSAEIAVTAIISEKVHGWLSYKIAEFITDKLKFTMGNLDITFGLHCQGVEWKSAEDDSLQAVGSTAPESDQGEIIAN